MYLFHPLLDGTIASLKWALLLDMGLGWRWRGLTRRRDCKFSGGIGSSLMLLPPTAFSYAVAA